MAPKESTSTAGNDQNDMLKKAFKCVNGTLDFEKLAGDMGVANGEAMYGLITFSISSRANLFSGESGSRGSSKRTMTL